MAKKSIQELLRGETRFGRLTVIGEAEFRQGLTCIVRYAHVRCDCGNEKEIKIGSITTGVTKSCGCIARERASTLARRTCLKHGDTILGNKAPEYGVYRTMLSRCNNPNVIRYPIYGGRGIAVCAKWSGPHGYEAFLGDMGRRPVGTSIERIDSNGNYEPGNCRWATAKEQSNNTRRNRRIEYDGQIKTLAEWAGLTGISGSTIAHRLKSGWTVERALSSPLR